MKPKVCVLMPVYNGEKTLMLAIYSLKQQTYQNWICVIVNDGSTDNTKFLLESLNDIRFKIINLSQNRGRAFARQVCLDNSEGDYLAFLDADDFYHPQKIERQVEAFDLHPGCKMIASGVLSMTNKYEPLSMRGFRKTPQLIQYMPFNKTLFFPPSVMIIREKAISLKYNFYLNAGEDNDFFSMYLADGSYFLLNKVYYYYLEDLNIPLKKFIPYYYYEFVRIANGLLKMNSGIFTQIKQTFIAGTKLIFVSLSTPVFGTSFLVSKRGSKLTEEENLRFKSTKDILLPLKKEILL